MYFLAFSSFRTFYFRKILAFTFHYTIEAGVLVRAAVQELAREYLAYRENTLYRSVMNVIIKANEELFKEESNVCEAIIDLFRDEYDKGIADAKELGVQQGIEKGVVADIKCMMKNLHLTMEQAMEALEIPAGEQERYRRALEGR